VAGDVRNDIYIALMQGEFRRGSKMADKNVEITLTVCNQDGEVIPVC
jgi:dedicator of cytokinesis protein 1